MKTTSGRYVGSTEDRINKWMRMCLQWQFDIRRGIEKKPNHYFTKYHVGKYSKKFFDDLPYSVVDRNYVINKMNLISEDRMKRDRKLGHNSNKVVIKQADYADSNKKGRKISEDTILKNVAKSSINLSDVSTEMLMAELSNRLQSQNY